MNNKPLGLNATISLPKVKVFDPYAQTLPLVAGNHPDAVDPGASKSQYGVPPGFPRVKVDRAVRNGRPLSPAAEPKLGDTLWIFGVPHKLVSEPDGNPLRIRLRAVPQRKG